MTNTNSASAGSIRAANDSLWKRRDHIHKGHRKYSSLVWLRWYLDRPAPKRPGAHDDQAHLPELPAKFFVLDLDAEPGTPRLLSLTERLRRYEQLVSHFADITTGRFVPTVYPPFVRKPHLPPSPGPAPEWHGPSPERRERATAIWTALPANDSDIFPRQAVTESPKLAHLADRLAPLLKWARAQKPIDLDSTNWLKADNDNYGDDEEPAPKPASNRERRIRPGSTDAELKSFIAKAGPCQVRRHAKKGGGGEWELMPTDTDWVEVIDKYKDGLPSKTHNVMSRAGKLHLATGKRVETYMVAGEGMKEHRVEEGSILFQAEKFGELLGAEPDDDEKAYSRNYWTSLFGTGRAFRSNDYHAQELEPIRFKRAGRIQRKVLITPAEQADILATMPHPPVTHYKPGLPCGAEDIGSQFLGGWISNTKGKPGIEQWQDVSDELSRQAEFDQWADALPPEQRAALNLACTAANFREVGEAFGKQGKTAERYGKKIVIASNDNLKKAMAA